MKLSIREIRKDIKIVSSIASVAVVLIGLLVGSFHGGSIGSASDASSQRQAQSALQASVPVSISNAGSDRSARSPKSLDSAESFEAHVKRVVDGDTVVVSRDDQGGESSSLTVRLIGINTPETVDPRRKVECFGKEASARAKEILPAGREVRIVIDPTQDAKDKYGRLLGYVFVPSQPAGKADGSSGAATQPEELFFNKYMIEQGYAYEYTYDKAYTYQKEFRVAQKVAEAEGRGLWSADTCNGKKAA